MQASYDFSGAHRGAVARTQGKTRIAIWVDDSVLAAFRQRAASQGTGCQTLINNALKLLADEKSAPVTVSDLRRVLHEELHAA
jgi:uncharacterized protein (DUF4415 family)